MKQPNIVIVLMDTMRMDALSAYNGSLIMPSAEALAKDSVVYHNAIAPSSWTLPSHVSLFTGKQPSEHGIHETHDLKTAELVEMMHAGKLRLPSQTIVERLRSRGYNTFGISANMQISSYTGMDAGFNVFIDITKRDEAANLAGAYGRTKSQVARNLILHGQFGKLIELYRRRGEHVRLSENYPLDKGGNWITWLLGRSSIETPFFMFINMMEMHDPYPSDVKYVPNQFHMNDLFGIRKISPDLMGRIRREYFDQSRIADEYIGRIMKFLKGVYDETLIILTSDHGQALRERDYYGHGIYLYDELVRIPLVVKYPGSARPEQSGIYSLADMQGMIMDAVDGAFQWKGRDFTVSETYGIQDSLDGIGVSEEVRNAYDVPRKAIFKGDYKLVVNGSTGTVEEFSKNGRQMQANEEREAYLDLLNELYFYRGSEKFTLPENG